MTFLNQLKTQANALQIRQTQNVATRDHDKDELAKLIVGEASRFA